MKIKQFFCLIFFVTIFSAVSANLYKPTFIDLNLTSNVGHKINGYKYLCMADQGNQYNLEDKFNAFFASIGFTILTPEEEENLDDSERIYVLYGTYEHKTVPNGLNNTTLTLRDKNGGIIFSTTKESACFISVKSCVNKGSDKIISQIVSLNYSFDPTLVKENANTYSSEEALQELERWKRKLDLQIITQSEYDKKKQELMKYID